MRGGHRTALIGAAIALVILPLTLSAASRAALKQARRLLERIKLVDGQGSGLDADTVRGFSPLVVRDAAGALVGVVVARDAPISVARTVAGRAMVFQVTTEGLVRTTCPDLCYESTDCTGTPYLDATDTLLPYVSVCGTTGYYQTGSAAEHVKGSCRTLPSDPCSPQLPGSMITATTLATFDTGDLGLLAPFHVEGP